MEESRSEIRFWLTLAAAAVIAILVSAVRWSLAHPYGIHWDESSYLNEAFIDAQRLHYGMILKLGGRILLKSWGKPPAYRLLADPFLATFGLHITTARMVSLACYALSSWFVYLAARHVAGKTAGGFAVLVFCLSPEVVSASIFFGTDAPLYLAVSAMLYYLLASWDGGRASAGNWIGLGLAVGLGLLAKASFVIIAGPALLFWAIVGRRSNLGGPTLAAQCKAAVLAIFVAVPWWLVNAKGVIAYGQFARNFVRNSLGPPSPGTWMRWLNSAFQCLLGPGLGILIIMILIATFVGIVVREKTILDPLQKAAIGVCACAGAPIVLAQLSGTNHLLRHVSPAVVPLAIGMGVLANQTGWIRSVAGITASAILLGAQLLMIVYPVIFPNVRPVDLGFVNGAVPWRVMSRFDQWDWQPLREISDDCGLSTAKIAYLGGGREFDPPAIQYPWVEAATATRAATFDLADPTWLWRYEDGTLDWRKVMDAAEQSDIALTAPHFIGEVENKEDQDNRHNAEFADRLTMDPHFRGPIRISVGRFEPIEIDVFVNKAIACHAPQVLSAGLGPGK